MDFLQFGNGHPFDPKPDCISHMCHWEPWADHFKDHEGDVGVLARMLGYCLEEKARLCNRLGKFHHAQAELLFAFIELVETGKPKPFEGPGWKPISLGGAWKSIQVLNQWRAKNKLNIKAVDVS